MPHSKYKLIRKTCQRLLFYDEILTVDLFSLPGMVASEVALPVIGVPVRASVLDGMDSLLSIVQMPRGIPCATVRDLHLHLLSSDFQSLKKTPLSPSSAQVYLTRNNNDKQVGIGNSTNAALLAIRILGAAFPEYTDKMKAYQEKMKNEVLAKDEKMFSVGWQQYLSSK